MPLSSSRTGRGTGRSRPTGSADALAGDGPEAPWISAEVEALASAWARGEPITAEEVLARHPGIGAEAAVRLIYEEVCLRRESGQEVATAQVVGRFPRWKDELEVLLGCDRLLRPMARAAVLPEIGAELGPFRLLAELGRGASGKTYLAAEPALAQRLVVLKVIPDDQEEHLSLARLQQTHIVPLFSEHAFPDRGLRALCMPYLGGTSLAGILEALTAIPPEKRQGRHVLDVLERVQAGRPAPSMPDSPYRLFLEQASYVQAVCWIGACLADALHCAHAHGLIHMDVKPSNVLIAADGLPMLLDFHLARPPIQAGERVPDRIGGTPDWMAPEHRAALEAVSRGDPVPQPVDHRADLYALGLLLRAALGAPGAAQPQRDGRSWRRRNPEVSAGLADIVAQCLADRPAERYRAAVALADDLRRHLNDLPLRGVPNRSPSERWRKWRRRQPSAFVRATAWMTALVSLTTVIGLAVVLFLQWEEAIRTALNDGRAFAARSQFAEAIHTLRHGLELAAALPWAEHLSLTGDLRAQLGAARRGRDTAALHRLADLVRFRYGIASPSAGEGAVLLGKIRTIWDKRYLLLAEPAGVREPELDQQVRADLLELATSWAELRTRLAAPAQVQPACDEAVRVLEEARDCCGPSFAIDRLRRDLARLDLVPETDPAPRSAADHYDLGRSYLRAGRLRAALEEFRRTLDQRPLDFWSNFYQGLCAYRLGEYPDAFAAFGISIALAPDSAACYFNRALAAEAMGRAEQAYHDYSHALERDPHLADALLNRGIVSYKARRYDDAVADFRRALAASSDPRALGRIHYNLALAYLARDDRPSALAHAEEAVTRGDVEAAGLRDRLLRTAHSSSSAARSGSPSSR